MTTGDVLSNFLVEPFIDFSVQFKPPQTNSFGDLTGIAQFGELRVVVWFWVKSTKLN